jgi:septal ring factor EnvC (AmiA/AmiB activator)
LKNIRIYYPRLKYLLILLICLAIYKVKGQNREKLKELQSKAKQEIEYASKILEETKEKKKYSLNELKILEYRIDARNKYIRELTAGIEDLNLRISDNRKLITSLEADLKTIKSEYARIIVNAYKKREQDVLLMYILASGSFNQAYKRVRYIQQYTKYRQKQAKLIAAFKNIIEKKLIELNRDRDAKGRLIKEKEKENINIIREKANKETLVRKLTKRENELIIELEEKRKLADKIKKELEKLIEEERSRQKGVYSMLTPEERLISDNFEKNIGKLPWPTKYGIITGKYGEQPHPVLKNIKIRNDGIDISTVRDAEVRAIFNGKVSKIFSIPGENYTLIIRHGNYYTLYHNLKNINVSPGQTVYTKQKIGNVFTDEKTNQTILHFQIWKESQNINPESWLSN